ncbi:MAG TPA: hypothetical protein VLF91_00365 [Candidatus Saccharimonadales bacterium]|nr:hypothetical protein [Candidatus Saccharimonadales bacterium]
MSVSQYEALQHSTGRPELASVHPESLAPLADYLVDNIRAKTAALGAEGRTIGILDPDWCRTNPAEAGKLHADVIIGTYGSTYALPNKDPEANRAAIESGDLDVYLMTLDGQVTGTACMVNTHDGRAELGRSASIGKSGNTIIQDLRILDWLINSDTANKYHTLFTTLRSAPDRLIDGGEEDFVMRGGQAVTEHWRKFPGLHVNGVGPLYLKHGALEQFTVASITRANLHPEKPLFIYDEQDQNFIRHWHDEYQLPHPTVPTHEDQGGNFLTFASHYPPAESGLTDLVHADTVVTDDEHAKSLYEALAEVDAAGSPFSQVVLPIDRDTRVLQAALKQAGYQVFGYQPASDIYSAALLFGRVRPGTEVVPTHWQHQEANHPFWQNPKLHAVSHAVSRQW